jgi:transposase
MRWFCLRPPDKLKPNEQVLLEKLLAKDGGLALGYDLLQRFRQLLKAWDRVALNEWLHAAPCSDLSTFVSFANGIKADWAAVVPRFVCVGPMRR